VSDPSQGRYLTQKHIKHKQTSMPRVGFKPTIPAFERAKTVHALDRAATVIGGSRIIRRKNREKYQNYFLLFLQKQFDFSWHRMAAIQLTVATNNKTMNKEPLQVGKKKL
jgi:hypothetical protein